MSQEISKLSIGTVGSNALLMGDFQERADVMAQIKESAIDHLFIADHVSFHDGFGMDGLINAATLAAMNPDITVFLGVYLLALRHPVPVARVLAGKIATRWKFVALTHQLVEGEQMIAFKSSDHCFPGIVAPLNPNFFQSKTPSLSRHRNHKFQL
jgi:hypothetical protein